MRRCGVVDPRLNRSMALRHPGDFALQSRSNPSNEPPQRTSTPPKKTDHVYLGCSRLTVASTSRKKAAGTGCTSSSARRPTASASTGLGPPSAAAGTPTPTAGGLQGASVRLEGPPSCAVLAWARGAHNPRHVSDRFESQTGIWEINNDD